MDGKETNKEAAEQRGTTDERLVKVAEQSAKGVAKAAEEVSKVAAEQVAARASSSQSK
jgi:hypothetical protein